jgi:ADP-heptose:LPS heptosyltransferase
VFVRLKQVVAYVFDPNIVALWLAPLRTLRRAYGWRPRRLAVRTAKCILVVRPDEIGDVVLTTAFLRELRRAAPQARIALIVKAACLELVKDSPYLDAVHALNFGQDASWRHRSALIWAAWRLRWGPLLRWNFDLVLLPRRGPDHYDSELVGYVLSRQGALVVGRQFDSSDSIRRSLATDKYSNAGFDNLSEHEVLHSLHFLGWCGANAETSKLELWLTAADRQFARNAIDGHAKCVAIGTGAGHPTRCWSVDRFATVASWLRERYGCMPVLLGGPGDPEFDTEINLVGRTSLRQAAAVIERCVLFVGNDSGLMHIAAAIGTPVVEISGFPTDGDPNHYNSPMRFHPFGVPYRIVQPSPTRKSFATQEVSIDAVRLACSQLLS